MIRLFSILCLYFAFAGCSGQGSVTDLDAGGWRIAFEVVDSGRVAVCDMDGSHFEFITPDSLIAFHPATDSTGRTIYFCVTQRSVGANAVYSVATAGSNLKKLSDLPFQPSALAVSPSGRVVVVEGHYADESLPRLYRVSTSEGRMMTLTPASIPTASPVFSPEGSTFLFNNLRSPDTVWIGFVAGSQPLPLPAVTYKQCSIAPDGFSVAGIGGPKNTELRRYFFATQKDTVLVTAPHGSGELANPVFHPGGSLICLEQVASDGSSRVAIYDVKTSRLEYVPHPKTTARKPIWVR
jgi:hypothetical protein